ncbi:MAG TPA: DUF4062 domain-containing protein [Moraxellaceae bacterium]|nr:DUF4062 domain-containing protein [Moraxellaceae bacterium]
MSDKRYQVFISSTYADLQEERAVLTQVLPTLGCMPCGLDVHPVGAAAWTALKRLIDESDYYILMLGSRYGSLSPSGISYTHMEYVYASTKQKPILVLMHDSPDSRPAAFQEKTPEGRRQFSDFRQLLSKGLLAGWNDTRSLEAALRRYMPQLVKSRPAVGWVRATGLGSPEQAREIDRLKQRIAELEQERDQKVVQQSAALGPLAQGNDLFDVQYRCKAYAAGNCEDVTARSKLSWNSIFSSFAPHLSQPQHEDFMAARIAERVQEVALKDIQATRPKTHAVTDITLASLCFNTIKTQFRTLGLIRRVPRDDSRIWWQLTAAGEQHLASLLAVRRPSPARPG